MSATEPDFGRLPPHDVDAEEAVIAACMVDSSAAAECIAVVRPEHFFREKNGWIFAAICDLWSRGQDEINQVTVAHSLMVAGRLDECGGQAYLADVIRRLPTSVGAQWYAEIVRRDADYRVLIHTSAGIMQMAYEAPEEYERVLDRATEMILRLGVQRSRVMTRTTGEVLRGTNETPALADRLAEFLDNPHAMRGIPTGWHEIDSAIGGLEPTRLHTVMGGTSVGKSFFIQGTLAAIAKRDTPVMLVTTEMSADEVTERLVFMEAGVDRAEMQIRGGATADERERIAVAQSIVGALPYRICDVGEISMPALIGETKRQVRLNGVEVLGVDHIQHVRVPGERGVEEIQRVTAGLKSLAMNEYLPILAVSHVNRESVKSGRLGLSSGKGGGSIEQDSNIVITLEAVRWEHPAWVVMDEFETSEFQGAHGYVYVRATVNKNRGGMKPYTVRRLDWRVGGRFEPLREDGA